VLLAIEKLDLNLNDVVWGTGIGCAGRQTFNTWKGDNFAGTHGRVYAIAAGLRIALPLSQKIILTVGDGDAFGIGLKHLLNCARRNLDITVVVADNLGYQSTGGQFGLTTPLGSVTDSSPYGLTEPGFLGPELDILHILKAAGATFLARHSSLDGEQSVISMVKAIENPGFSLVHFLYPCVTHFGAVTLGERDKTKVLAYFRDIFKDPDGGGGELSGEDMAAADNHGRAEVGCRRQGQGNGQSPAIRNVPERSGFHLESGIFYDGSGQRPEFTRTLLEWTEKFSQAGTSDPPSDRAYGQEA
jgi:2-oxoglutarate ferredoxin oxidoreductase subunit beta